MAVHHHHQHHNPARIVTSERPTVQQACLARPATSAALPAAAAPSLYRARTPACIAHTSHHVLQTCPTPPAPCVSTRMPRRRHHRDLCHRHGPGVNSRMHTICSQAERFRPEVFDDLSAILAHPDDVAKVSSWRTRRRSRWRPGARSASLPPCAAPSCARASRSSWRRSLTWTRRSSASSSSRSSASARSDRTWRERTCGHQPRPPPCRCAAAPTADPRAVSAPSTVVVACHVA